MINIGKLGIWFSHNPLSIAESVALRNKSRPVAMERCGSQRRSGVNPWCTWPISLARRHRSSWLLASPTIWARDAVTMAAAQKTLVELSGNAFCSGWG